MSSDITLTDLFCGAGGSSTGAVKGGARVLMAANHWQLAIDTHQTNHPATDHDLADLMVTHPSRYKRTDILWISPECTNHSIAKGRKRKNLGQLDLWGDDGVDPSEERSRATMREVVEFTEYHRYEIVIVENVVDIKQWQHYDAWLTAMLNLGYEHQALYLNAQFFGVPQSRDRIYVVFWKRGNKRPQLDFRPPAYCVEHGEVFAVQAWKKPGARWGRYGDRRQYIYVCPTCGGQVKPYHVPAAAAIDWSIPSEKISDRKTPLKPKTMARIKVGLEKFKDRAVLVGHGIDEPLGTVTGSTHHALVMAPFLAVMKGELSGIALSEPMSTIVASACQHWLISPSMLLSKANQDSPARSASEPLFAVATQYTQEVVIPPFLMSYYSRNDAQSGIDEPIPTIPTEPRFALITPPIIVETGGVRDRAATSVNDPMHTQLTRQSMSLVTPPILMTYNAEAVYMPVDKPMPTVSTVQRHGLLTPDEMILECGFRMLEPEELKLGMSFPKAYIILGNKKNQVKQVGNAVCPNVAEWIVGRCVESLAS